MSAKKVGLAGIRTQVARFKVWSANHYTTKPFDVCCLLMALFLSFPINWRINQPVNYAILDAICLVLDKREQHGFMCSIVFFCQLLLPYGDDSLEEFTSWVAKFSIMCASWAANQHLVPNHQPIWMDRLASRNCVT